MPTPLILYAQANPNEEGFEAVRVELSEAFLARVARCFKLLSQHQLHSLSYETQGTCWLKSGGTCVVANSTIELWYLDHDLFGLAFSAHLNQAKNVGEFQWVSVSADWSPDHHFSSATLNEQADAAGCLFEFADDSNQQNGELVESRFIPTVAHFQLTQGEYVDALEASTYIDVFGEALPVVGSAHSVLAVQQLLNSLDQMPSHNLDMADLVAMFMRHQQWQALTVVKVAASEQLFSVLGDLKKACREQIDIWFLIADIGAVADLQEVIPLVLSEADFWLITYCGSPEVTKDVDATFILYRYRGESL